MDLWLKFMDFMGITYSGILTITRLTITNHWDPPGLGLPILLPQTSDSLMW